MVVAHHGIACDFRNSFSHFSHFLANTTQHHKDDGSRTQYSNHNQSDQDEVQDDGQHEDDYSDVGDGIGILKRGVNNGAFDSLFVDEVEDLSGSVDLGASPLLFETKSFKNSNKPDTNKKGALSSRANLSSEQQRKKKTKANSRKRKVKAPEKDNLRPESEQDLFTPLQIAKQRQRKVQQHNNSQQQATSTMVVTTRNTNTDKKKATSTETAGKASTDTRPGDAKISRKKTTLQQPESVAPAVSQDSTSESPGFSETSPNSNSASASTSEKRPRPPHDDGNEYSTLTDQDILLLCDKQYEKDKKLNIGDRLKLIGVLRKKIFTLRRDFGEAEKTSQMEWNMLKDQTKKLKTALGKTSGQVKELTAQNDILTAQASVRLSRAKAQVLKMCNDTRDKAFNTAKNVIFHNVKFLNCKDDLYSATEMVHDALQVDEKTLDQRDSWVETYAPVVKKGINSARNYVTSELKKVAFALLNSRETLPPHALLLACAARNISGINEEKFKWYWEKVIGKVVGSKEWGPTVCYYTTILEARMSTNPKKPLITVSDEAMIVLVWENNFEKWQTQWAFEQDPKNKGLKQPALPGKYTYSDKGQCEWGGWSEAGLQAFNNYKKTIRTYRKDKKDQILAFERRILAELRLEHKIQAEDHDQQLRVNRAKRRKLNAKKPVEEVVVRKVVKTFDSEDEQD